MHRAWLFVGTAGLLVLCPSDVLAQQAAASEPEQRTQAGGEIVVTAQKRAERLLDVPQSITAMPAEHLERLQATQLRDYANTVPALSFTTSGVGQSQISLRGVTTGTDAGPTVGIYVDDVPFGSSSAFANAASLGLDAGLFDLDRIEVLRGPQGTLYGASTMGGVLRYITVQPDLLAYGGQARAGISYTDGGGANYDGAAALNVPFVSDKAALRASGFYTHDDGFIDDPTRGEDGIGRSRIYGGRLDLLIQPSSELSVRLTAFAQNIYRDGTATADYTLAGDPIAGKREQGRVLAEPFEQRFRLVSGTIAYDFGGAELTSISSYQTVRSRYRQDISPVYVPLLGSLGLNFGAVAADNERSIDKFTQELRLASSDTGTVEWLVGGFYTHEDTGNGQVLAPYVTSGSLSPADLFTVETPSTYEEIAGFGNVTVHFTPAFDVTGGMRYAHNNQWFEQIGSGLLIGSLPKAKAKDDIVTWLANARYHFSRNAVAYVRFATGYRPGGPNFVASDPATGELLAPATFDPDTLKSYELGFKGKTADKTFGIDAALYHIDWKDIQAASAAAGIGVLVNAGKAKIDGGELTLRADPARNVNFSAAFAYQHARLAADEPLLGAKEGDHLPNVPRYSVAINGDWTGKQMNLRPTFGATLRFVSDRVASFDANPNLPQYRLPSYASLDLRAGVSLGLVDARLFVRNLFDTQGQLSAQTALSVLGGPAQVALLQPRTIGLSISSHF
ncbi:TonB-dependent receptor [Stakelama sp. CBK3Z-3]|uniref:TonB-dependent receptor n=1 Tax=Stakelama flava TaxID=2860338 RepID=A0ABS6XKN5_9SPHN|nr:TonB-dependent receptor [Stakelama flava]MBW4330768.1 TonB-dependent receptor [Stakelama flava]